MNLTAPALLTYSYLPLTGPHAGAAREHLATLWLRLRHDLGFDSPIDRLGVPDELPPSGTSLHANGSYLVAARERRDEEVWQAWVRVEHDVLCLAVMMAPARSADPADAWPRLEQSLRETGWDRPPFVGESRLFLALTTGKPGSTAKSVRAAAPAPATVGWSRGHDELTVAPNRDRAMFWELGGAQDERALRRLVLVAPLSHERAVDRLVWTIGDGELTPLARYLLHAAKLRYQIRVFQGEQVRAHTVERLDALEEELFRSAEGGRAEVLTRLDLAYRSTDLVLARLGRMRRGVGIIVENLHNALGPHPHDQPGGPISDDRTLARWFIERLDDEISLVGEAHERARTVLGTRAAPAPAPAHREPTPASVDSQAPMVFICYIHENEEHREAVLSFAKFLRRNGIDAQLDRWFAGRQDWYVWALDHIRRADFVIVIASPLCRIVGEGTIPNNLNLGGQSEMSLLRELLQQDRAGWTRKLIPVVLPGRSWQDLPLFLQPSTADHYPVTDLTPEGAESLLRVLTGQRPDPPPPVGQRVDFPPS